MAFICKNCAPKHAQWLFDLRAGTSYGTCEDCGRVSVCIDWHGSMESSDEEPTKSAGYDIDRYDKYEGV